MMDQLNAPPIVQTIGPDPVPPAQPFTPYQTAPTQAPLPQPAPLLVSGQAPVAPVDKPVEKVTRTASTTTATTTGGYGQMVGLVVQLAEIVAVGYLLIMAVSLNNHLAQQMLAPIVALVFAHNSLSPSQWGGGPPNS